MNNYDPLWAIRRDDNLKDPEPERADKDREYNDKRTSLTFKIVKWALVVAVLLYLLYTVCVHPVDKLRLGIALGGSCEIRILVYQGLGSGEATLKIDGNLMSITQGHSGSTEYYEIDGDSIYTYELSSNGEWKRVFVSSASESVTGNAFINILKGKNYERKEGSFSSYRIKDDVDIGSFKKVEFQRTGGKPVLTISDYDHTYYTLIFNRIGITRVTPPWKE